jgi:hypothetical protein
LGLRQRRPPNRFHPGAIHNYGPGHERDAGQEPKCAEPDASGTASTSQVSRSDFLAEKNPAPSQRGSFYVDDRRSDY